MELSEGIRKIGFRRWHERQLLQSHLYLASALLCIVAVLAALEGFTSREPSHGLFLGLVLMFGGGAVGGWAFLRYVQMLITAQRAADRSVCAKCRSYGLLESVGTGARHRGSDADGLIVPTRVRCRRCGNEWTME